MDLQELCRIIEVAVCHIVIETDDSVASAGTGVYVGNGSILTARHVLFQSPGRPFVGALSLRSADGAVQRTEGRIDFPTLNVDLPTLMRPIPIDLAVLRPRDVPSQLRALPMDPGIAKRGTEVIMAGFTDEIPYPLDFAEFVEVMNPDMTAAKNALDKKFKFFMRPLMMKRAMVGAVNEIRIGPEGAPTLTAASYVLDNDLTYGGSGGPVVDLEGRLLGLVTRKATTSAKELRIASLDGGGGQSVQLLFSGSAVCLSHHLISQTLLRPRS